MAADAAGRHRETAVFPARMPHAYGVRSCPTRTTLGLDSTIVHPSHPGRVIPTGLDG